MVEFSPLFGRACAAASNQIEAPPNHTWWPGLRPHFLRGRQSGSCRNAAPQYFVGASGAASVWPVLSRRLRRLRLWPCPRPCRSLPVRAPAAPAGAPPPGAACGLKRLHADAARTSVTGFAALRPPRLRMGGLGSPLGTSRTLLRLSPFCMRVPAACGRRRPAPRQSAFLASPERNPARLPQTPAGPSRPRAASTGISGGSAPSFAGDAIRDGTRLAGQPAAVSVRALPPGIVQWAILQRRLRPARGRIFPARPSMGAARRPPPVCGRAAERTTVPGNFTGRVSRRHPLGGQTRRLGNGGRRGAARASVPGCRGGAPWQPLRRHLCTFPLRLAYGLPCRTCPCEGLSVSAEPGAQTRTGMRHTHQPVLGMLGNPPGLALAFAEGGRITVHA